MTLRLIPLAVDAVAGGVDGMFQHADNKANSGKTPGAAGVTIQDNTRLYRGGLVAAGLIGSLMMRSYSDLTEPLLFGGLFGLTSSLGYHLAAGKETTTVTVAAAGPGGYYGAAAAARYQVMPALQPAQAYPATWSDASRRQSAGAAG